MAVLAITGASGFLGSHLVLEAVATGHTPISVVRDPARCGALPGERRRADVGDPRALRRAFAGVDAVIANASLAPGWTRPAPERFEEVNVRGVEHTLRAAHEAGVGHIVLVSTVGVLQIRRGAPLGVDAPYRDPDRLDLSALTTNRHYTRSKALGEQRARSLAAELGLALTVVRPGPLFGPRDHKLSTRVGRLLQRRVLPVPTVRTPLAHAGDVARALVAAVETPPGRTFHLTGPPVSWLELLRTWRDVRGRGPRLVPIPVPVALHFDDGGAAAALGFRPRTLRAGVEDTEAWLQSLDPSG